MTRFEGLEVKPYSAITKMPERVKIDRVWVEVHETLFGEVRFSVIGKLGHGGEDWPLMREVADCGAAIAKKKEIEAAIRAASRGNER